MPKKNKLQNKHHETMQALAKECGLTYDGYETYEDDRLFAETINTNSKDYSRKEYKAMEKDINNYVLTGTGFEVYAWNDGGGYEYWTCKQEEDNYIQITATILDASKVNPAELKRAMERTYGHFYGYSRY